MKSKALITFTILFLSASTLLFAQRKDSKEPAKHRIVMQFNDPDSVSQTRTLLQVQNVRKIWPDAQIEVVCLGGGLDLLMTKNSKASNLVAEWSGKGVIFAACNNTMINRKVTKEDLLPQAVVVPAAVIELATKQEEGWSYFRAGK
jgi:intracellular sulfur oxidation DsrE/DsrF family protein